LYISDDPQGDVVDRQLVEARCQRPAPLEPADHTLNDVAAAIRFLVEVLLARLVLARRDDWLDVVPPQPGTHPRITVALVGGRLLRPARPARLTRSSRPLHGLREALGFMTLALGHPHGQQDAPAVTDQMDLGAEAALRTSQRMPLGLLHLRRCRSAQSRHVGRIFFSPRRQRPRRG